MYLYIHIYIYYIYIIYIYIIYIYIIYIIRYPSISLAFQLLLTSILECKGVPPLPHLFRSSIPPAKTWIVPVGHVLQKVLGVLRRSFHFDLMRLRLMHQIQHLWASLEYPLQKTEEWIQKLSHEWEITSPWVFMGSLKLPTWFLLASQTHWEVAPTSALPARSTCGSPRDCFRGPVPSCWSPPRRRSGFRCARVCSSRALWLGHGRHGATDQGHVFKRHAYWGKFKVLTRTKQNYWRVYISVGALAPCLNYTNCGHTARIKIWTQAWRFLSVSGVHRS